MRTPRSYSFAARFSLLAASFLPLVAPGATYTWVPTAAGTTYDWNSVTNWNPNTAFPNAVGDVANLDINILGSQTIRLNVPITLGALYLGDPTATYYGITLNAGTAGSLIFQTASGPAVLQRNGASSVSDVINANILLNSSLNILVPTAATSNLNSLVINGLISGAGGLNILIPSVPTTSTNNIVDITNTNNSYTGDTVISNGALVYRGNVLLGQNSALGNSTSAVKVGSSSTQIGTGLENGTNSQLRLKASNDTDNYVFERDLDFSGNTGTATQNGRSRFTLDSDGAGGANTNTLTISGTVTLGSNGRTTEFLAAKQGQTIRFTGQILAGIGTQGTVFINPSGPGNSTDGRNNGTIRFSDLARTFTSTLNLTAGTLIIEGSVAASGASPIGTGSVSLGDGNGGNIFSPGTEGANRRLFLDTPGTSYARGLAPSAGTGSNLGTATNINGVLPAVFQPLYGNSGNVGLVNGYEFGGLNTSGTVTFSASIAAQTVTVPVTGTAAGAGGTNVVTVVHNIALTAATGGTTVFSGVISGSTAPITGSSTPGAAGTGNNTRITINQFRNHANLDVNVDGIKDTNANQLVGTATQGTVVLSAANTYSGGTEVLGGTLLVNNTTGSGTGTGAVAVTAGTLGGNGFITTTQGLTVAQGSTIRPGDANTAGGLGVLTVNAPVTLNATGGSILGFQISRTTSDVNAGNLTVNLNGNGSINWDAIAANTGGLYNKDSAINNDTLAINGTLTANTSGLTIVKVGAGSGASTLTYSAGMVWDLMDWTTLVNANSNSYTFELDAELGAALAAQGFMLDSSRFWDTGYVGIIVAIPEPSRGMLGLLGLGAIILRRRRSTKLVR